MKNLKYFILLFLVGIIALSCKQQQARMPVSRSSGEFLNASVERNKKLNKIEEDEIQLIIKSNPNVTYISSKKGYWYYYENKNDTDSILPKKGDVAFFDYEIKDLKGKIIYSQEELKPQTYLVDKQNIMMGLRDGIKLMKKNEKVTFLFPSNMAFGYHGDNDRISENEPLICTVTLNDFKLDTTPKKQNSTPKQITTDK